MKRQMPWPGAGPDLSIRRIVGRQLTLVRVQPVYHHPIHSQIWDEGIVVGRVGDDHMCVRSFLTRRIDAGPLMLYERSIFPDTPVFLDRKHGDCAGAVVSHEHTLRGGIHIDGTWQPAP